MSSEPTPHMVLVDLEDLLDLEWSRHGKCPVCDYAGPFEGEEPDHDDHAADCWLGKAIKEALKEVHDNG